MLGAGFDTRAWRLPACVPRRCSRSTTPTPSARSGRSSPGVGVDGSRPEVRFVPTDFHLGRLSAAMAAAGHDVAVPTLFLWEGTTNYLTADAVDATLRWCAAAAPGSHLVFTYIDEDVLTDPDRYHGADACWRRSAGPASA